MGDHGRLYALPNSLGSILLALAFVETGCGPGESDPDSSSTSDEQDANGEGGCAETSCPEELLCGPEQRVCPGGLRLAECIEDRCSPAPRACAGPEAGLGTCREVCESSGLVCADVACGGATIFTHPGPDWVAGDLCGSNKEAALEQYSPVPGDCETPLTFDGYAYAQCCCDDST